MRKHRQSVYMHFYLTWGVANFRVSSSLSMFVRCQVLRSLPAGLFTQTASALLLKAKIVRHRNNLFTVIGTQCNGRRGSAIECIPVPSEGVNFCPGLFFLLFQTGVNQNRPRQDATRQKTPFGR